MHAQSGSVVHDWPEWECMSLKERRQIARWFQKWARAPERVRATFGSQLPGNPWYTWTEEYHIAACHYLHARRHLLLARALELGWPPGILEHIEAP